MAITSRSRQHDCATSALSCPFSSLHGMQDLQQYICSDGHVMSCKLWSPWSMAEGLDYNKSVEHLFTRKRKLCHAGSAVTCPPHSGCSRLELQADLQPPCSEPLQCCAMSDQAPTPTNIPDKPGIYLRKDYAAACPQEHLAYLHCLQNSPGITSNRCLKQWDEFSKCVVKVMPAHRKGETPPAAVAYWRNLQKDPYWGPVIEQFRGFASRLGIGGRRDGDSNLESRDSSSDAGK